MKKKPISSYTFHANFIIIILLISVSVFSCFSVDEDAIRTDTESPSVTNTIITFSTFTANTITLHWMKAADNVTPVSALQYWVVSSLQSNVSSIEDVLNNGTIVKYWTPNIDTITATGLSLSTTYYFNVLVRDEAGNTTVYTIGTKITAVSNDIDMPTPGNTGTLTFSSIKLTSITVNWTKAIDNMTSQVNLQYKVVRSLTNNIDTVQNATNNGILVQDWTPDITSVVASGLSPGTTNFFNVLVRDEAGNIAAYTMDSRKTASSAIAPWPGDSGIIAFPFFTNVSVVLQWTRADDDITQQEDLQYKVYRSFADDISTVIDVTNNGTVVSDWIYNIDMTIASNLTPVTLYYFNILVLDENGNISAYTSENCTTIGP